jgi:hypothetical protein
MEKGLLPDENDANAAEGSDVDIDEGEIAIPSVRSGAYLGPYEKSDLAEVGIKIVRSGDNERLKEWVRRVNSADKSEGPPIAKVADFEWNTPLHVACAETSNVRSIQILLDGHADWSLENEFGLNCVHLACAKGDLTVIEYMLSRGGISFVFPSGIFKCKGFDGDGARCHEDVVEYGYCETNPLHVRLAVEERRRQRELAVKRGLADVTDDVGIDAENPKAQAVKDLVARSPSDIAQMRGHGPVVRLIDAYLEGNAFEFEKTFKEYLVAETDYETEAALEKLKNVCSKGWKARGRAKINLRAYLYLAMLNAYPNVWTHGKLERTLRGDGYRAMENRLQALVKSIYVEKRCKYVLNRWALSCEEKLQETLEVVSDIYQVHVTIPEDDDEFGENSLLDENPPVNKNTPSINYMCDRHSFLIKPIEITMKPFASTEILDLGTKTEKNAGEKARMCVEHVETRL